MRTADIENTVLRWRGSPLWYEREAEIAYRAGWWLPIMSRTADDVYMLRFWLTEPTLGDGDVTGSDFTFDDALVLHCILRPDDDSALHDHPAPFRTTVLDGCYCEALPPENWNPIHGLGPSPFQRERLVRTGDTIDHEAADLHAITNVAPGTWTLVRIGQKCRAWGFHPFGQPWMPWRDYLAQLAPKQAEGAAV